jgi:hypothetical protein
VEESKENMLDGYLQAYEQAQGEVFEIHYEIDFV